MTTHRFLDRIQVFGSNTRGRHGKGAAADAARHYGAEEGVGEGLTGRSYALPTKDDQIQTLPLSAIEDAWARFIGTAEHHTDKTFYVTRVGCGLAGYTNRELLQIVERYDIPDNVILPGVWRLALRQSNELPLIVAGGREFNDFELLTRTLEDQLNPAIQKGYAPVIVSGRARGADSMGEQFAKEHGFGIEYFPAPWKEFEQLGYNVKAAGHIRNAMMGQYAAALSAFWDGKSRGTDNMIRNGESFGLKVRVTHYNLKLEPTQPSLI